MHLQPLSRKRNKNKNHIESLLRLQKVSITSLTNFKTNGLFGTSKTCKRSDIASTFLNSSLLFYGDNRDSKLYARHGECPYIFHLGAEGDDTLLPRHNAFRFSVNYKTVPCMLFKSTNDSFLPCRLLQLAFFPMTFIK